MGVPQKYADIDDYIKNFSPEVQDVLERIRKLVHKIAPDVEESITYHMPTFKVAGKGIIYFAAWSKHVAFYALPVDLPEFKEEFAPYIQSKGTVQFKFDAPMPWDLIEKVIKYRAKNPIDYQ